VLEPTAGAKSAIHAFASTPSGRVVIGMPRSVGAVVTATLVQQMRAEFRHVSLGVIEGFSVNCALSAFEAATTRPE